MDRRIRLGMAVACAALAALACGTYAHGVRESAAQVRAEALATWGGETVRVLVATRALEVGEEAGTGNAELRDWLVDLVPEGALTSASSAEGRALSAPVPKGGVFTETCYRTGDEAVPVPAGRVAVTLTLTDKLGVTADVAPGTAVVAYATSGEQARLVSASAQVLAVRPREGGASAATLTLAVPPEDVTALLSASVREGLRLVRPADDVTAIPDGATPEEAEEALVAPTSVPPVEEAPAEGVAEGEGL